jgi:predicted DNA-binding transcriptional regulator AlpA
MGTGPAGVKLGGKNVRYSLAECERWEREQAAKTAS